MPSPEAFHLAIYLTGATASGKSAVGVALAKLIGAEVVALDSMTLYRGMDIGTAKPTVEERGDVPHHLIDVLDPWEVSSVADYRGWAAGVVADIEARGRRALFVGGTPLYLKALLRGLFEGPAADVSLRASLEQEANDLGDPALHARLAAIDGPTAARLHPNDRRRLIRAIEVHEITARRLSDLQQEHDRPAEGVAVIAIERPRPILHARIDARVVAMVAAGLVDEARRLRDAPRTIGAIAGQGVGYREALARLDGVDDEAEMIAKIQARTRQFAKRQATWFRGLDEVNLWPVDDEETAEQTAERIARLLERGSESRQFIHR